MKTIVASSHADQSPSACCPRGGGDILQSGSVGMVILFGQLLCAPGGKCGMCGGASCVTERRPSVTPAGLGLCGVTARCGSLDSIEWCAVCLATALMTAQNLALCVSKCPLNQANQTSASRH